MVYFSILSDQIITKDALSKVSRHFFKEIKMNYRHFGDQLCETLFTLKKFFEASLFDTVRTFFEFNFVILCETLATEQFKLALTVTKER